MKKYLYLQDGTHFEGTAFGATNEIAGEVVFNTSMVGYQEALSDPSYANQLLTFTYPLIGTYGVDMTRNQSTGVLAQCAIVHTLENEPGPDGETLNDYLLKYHVPGIQGVDTRQLTKHIRQSHTMQAVLLNQPLVEDFDAVYTKLFAQCQKTPQLGHATYHSETAHAKHVVMIDFGTKQGIIDSLVDNGISVTVVPYTTDLAMIQNLHPDGILLSNGPGDPADYDVLPLIQKLEHLYPTAGICLGHQILALANGAKTVAMAYGHRGINHPVHAIGSDHAIITSQNHGYMVDPDSLAGTDLVVTAVEGDDGTIEGLAHQWLPMFTVQYHPEANPGPKDASGFFTQFKQLMEKKVAAHA